MAERSQKAQKTWEEEYKRGEWTPWGLWKSGFRPRSNKYRSALKEYKYYHKYYSISLTLTPDDYEELKGCGSREAQQLIEESERAEYQRFLYLQDKYGKED